MSVYEKWTLVLQAAVALAAFVSLWMLYRQVRIMFESTRAQSALALASFLQAPDVRNARECVRSSLSQKHHSEWTEEEKRQASLVCANYDVAAGLLKARVAPVELFVANWAPSIAHCHQVLAPYISELRARQGGRTNYWANFDWLRSQIGPDK